MKQFGDKLKKAKSRVINICLEFEQLNISSADPVLRLETIDPTKSWIDHAVALGSRQVKMNRGTPRPTFGGRLWRP